MLLSMKYEIEFFSTIHSNLVLIPCSSNKGLMEKNENTENKTIFQSKRFAESFSEISKNLI